MICLLLDFDVLSCTLLFLLLVDFALEEVRCDDLLVTIVLDCLSLTFAGLKLCRRAVGSRLLHV